MYKTKDVDLSGGSQAGGWEHASTGEHKINDHYAQELAGEDYQLFAGGYAIKGDTMSDERPSLDPVMGATYKGMAVGRVYTDIKFGDGVDDAHRRPYFIANGIGDYDVDSNSDGINDSYSVDIAHDIAKTFVTQNAEMKITRAGGQVVQTLTMPFHTNPVGDKYYDIEIKQTGNTVNYVDFDTDNDAGIAAKYKLYDAENHWDTEHASFNPGYYGVDIATEAAGTATICAPEYSLGGEDGAKRTYEVQAAWGMIKQ